MPPRLAVVISQTPTRDHRAADIEESLVAELMMAGGLDANIVGPLQRIAPDSTDLLCLAGFTQDIALLSWLSIAEAEAVWAQLRLPGTFVDLAPTELGPSNAGSSATVASPIASPNGSAIKGRRVLYLQLEHDSHPADVCKLLKTRLQNMQIKTVQLLPLQSSSKGTLPVANLTTSSVAPTRSPYQASNSDASATSQQPIAAMPTVSRPAAAVTNLATGQSAEETELDRSRWKDLDKLVDDLDALDL
jgi:hypothetical protein